MSTHEAKRDCVERLKRHGVAFDKVTAKTVSMMDLARCAPVFVTIHGAAFNGTGTDLKLFAFSDLEKPSAGGYVVNFEQVHAAIAKASGDAGEKGTQ